jgi:diguanylate cyclase (GGDEF)-like protein
MFKPDNTLSKEILNILPEHICILNPQGNIVFVNSAWINYERANTDKELTDWVNINYLDVCDISAQSGSELAQEVALGIRAVLNEKKLFFQIEYPCHSPGIQKWFLLSCLPFNFDKKYYLLRHLNITQKIEANINSNIDPLTLVGNRRSFDEFLDCEWRRCARLNLSITAIIIDIDNFKQFNDTYGHVKGDHCLKKVSEILKGLVHRPSDIFCRYGGEEFIYILGNTDIHRALRLCDKIHRSIRSLNIAHSNSNTAKYISVSIGTASLYPVVSIDKEQLVEQADNYLYQAKANGKNTTGFHNCEQKPCQPTSYY